MNPLRPNTVGIVFGILLATCHLFWAILVGVGMAQPLMDFIFNLHMIAPVFTITAFNISKAVALVLVTGGIGYVLGVAIAVIWNRCKAQNTLR